MATVLSRAQCGMDAIEVRVEVDLGAGLPTFTIVGLPETVVKESRDRVRAAIVNSNFEMPSGRITVSLAPADLPKEGGRFDLPIALGILIAAGQLPRDPFVDCEFYGELSLSGELRAIKGILVAAIAATAAKRKLIVPVANLDEAALITGCEVAAAKQLLEVAAHAAGNPLDFMRGRAPSHAPRGNLDLYDVLGQPRAKRALEIAAAGEHSLLFVGPPGTGKSMLAQRLPGILPSMTDAEALEAASVRALIGPFKVNDWGVRPFRAPHHTASAIALVGGGSYPRPGEISLAHRGVLFLDELPEFQRRVLEVLREPIESGVVTISRAALQTEFPARFQLIAAMNPCPCGYLGDTPARCRCTAEQVQRYRSRISGPLLDRLDMHVEVGRIAVKALQEAEGRGESSAQVAARVATTRELQLRRQGVCNAHLDHRGITQHCTLEAEGKRVLARAVECFALSARAHQRILKLARTVADLRATERVAATDIAEAINLRQLDRAAILAR
ncbi:MAG: YifB family Mg chelatase-like AAA ATPase [Steroidobacteraceae bacterium]